MIASYLLTIRFADRQRPGFSETSLRSLVEKITADAGFFVEIVNLNVRNSQYVCAGDLRALDLLQHVLDAVKKGGAAADASSLAELVAKNKARYQGVLASGLVLSRGAATVPLPGVDVPFHSSFLRPRMEAFRRVLLANLETGRIRPERLVGKYIPNVMGRPFEIGRDYVQDVLRVTESERVKAVLDDWEGWMGRADGERRALMEVSAV